jgi:hypothetical protein
MGGESDGDGLPPSDGDEDEEEMVAQVPVRGRGGRVSVMWYSCSWSRSAEGFFVFLRTVVLFALR